METKNANQTTKENVEAAPVAKRGKKATKENVKAAPVASANQTNLISTFEEITLSDYINSKSFAPESLVLIKRQINQRTEEVTYKCFNFKAPVKTNDVKAIVTSLFKSVINHSRTISDKRATVLKSTMSYTTENGKIKIAETLGDTGLIRNTIGGYLDTCSIFKTNNRGYIRVHIVGDKTIKQSILRRMLSNKFVMLSAKSSVMDNVPLFVDEFLEFYRVNSVTIDGEEMLKQEGAVKEGKILIAKTSASDKTQAQVM